VRPECDYIGEHAIVASAQIWKGNSPWDIAALGRAVVAVFAGICPALNALAKRLGSANGRASGANSGGCANGSGPDERHGEAV
jgi:hypothetical protein